MAKKIETGIIITASSKGLKKGVKGAKKSLIMLRKGLGLADKGVRKFGSSYQAGIDTVFKSVEVFKSIQGLLTDTVGRFLEASAQFRFAGDSQIKAITGFKREAERVVGAFGDIFTAMFAGLSDAVGPTVKSLRVFIEANRELVGTKIVEFLAQTAQTIVDVLGPAINYGYKIFSGWKNIINLTKAAVAGLDSVFSDLAAGMSEMDATTAFQNLHEQQEKSAELVEEYRKASGEEKKELFKQIEIESQKTKELRFEYKKVSQARDDANAAAEKSAKASQKAQADAAREILEQEKNMEELERVVKQVQAAMGKGISAAATAMMKRLREEIKTTGKTEEERDKERDAAEKRRAEEAKKRAEATKKAADLAKKAADEEAARLEQQKALQAQLGGTIGSGIGGALRDVIQGTKSASDAMKDFALQTAQAVAKALILSTIQKAVAVGTMGAGAGGLVAGLAGSFFNFNSGGYVPGFASGGYVPGFASGGGVDSVRAMLTPGEFVLPKGLVDSIKLGKAPPKAAYANGGTVSAGVSQGPAAINVSMNTFAVPSKGEFRRWYKSSVSPNTKKMGKRGQL